MTARVWWTAFFALGFAVGCRVALGDDRLYACASDADCGGDGYVCATPTGQAPRCCRPDTQETCNGLDDNCNGQVDEGFVELCNGADDNCNGQVDEGFFLLSDTANCGTCGHACAATDNCVGGTCKVRGETNCGDGVDNDSDNSTDCVDIDCTNQPCGVACSCRNGLKAEVDCTNATDDDGDGQTDCLDADCNGVACAGGCVCDGGVKTETACNDSLDNDGNGGADCLDTDCSGKLCKPAPQNFTCNGTTCACPGGVTSETGVARCRNGQDDDCNGLSDCEETSCNGVSCMPDGGSACQCQGGKKSERNCADREDNDGDFLTDCREMLPDGGGECPLGTACTYLQGNVKNGNCAWDAPSNAGKCQ